MYMPRRPGMRALMEAKGATNGMVGDQISWPIDALVPGDVYVADCFGKVGQKVTSFHHGPTTVDHLLYYCEKLTPLRDDGLVRGCPDRGGADHRR